MAINDYLRTSSLYVDGNLNFRRFKEKRRYNSWLIGSALRSDLGHESIVNNLTTRPPSWTQTDLNLNHAFVIEPLSSSYHENQNLNAYLSGTYKIENSVVPASGTLFYSKSQRYVTQTYKMTASIYLDGYTTFSSVSGAMFGRHTQMTASINVPDYGKLIDIRVWVEFVHDKGASQNSGSLATTTIALKSPNVRFGYPIPYMNDPDMDQFAKGIPIAGAEFYNDNKSSDAFPLWIGGLKTWGNDYSIRTIFTDSSRNNNPRDASLLFSSGSTADETLEYLMAYGAPHYAISGIGEITGGFKPWTSDATASPMSDGAAGSPPVGWLNGAGGKNDVNEWPTTGSNYGPNDIRPAYPLLDPIVEVRNYRTSGGITGSFSFKRPGLRGTEINGRWDLLIYRQAGSVILGRNNDGWFRQFRLELTYEKNCDTKYRRSFVRSLGAPYEKEGGKRRVAVLTGSDIDMIPSITGMDSRRSFVYIEEQNSYGRTIGITNNTSSLFSGDFAVFTRITGSLYNRLTGSEHDHYRYKFLNNEFGTPFLSLASGSGEYEYVKTDATNNKIIADIFNQKKLIGAANTIKAALSKYDTTTRLSDKIITLTSGSS